VWVEAFVPRVFEGHCVPSLGRRPQPSISAELVDGAHSVVVLFVVQQVDVVVLWSDLMLL
jgi:hypothetical protein